MRLEHHSVGGYVRYISPHIIIIIIIIIISSGHSLQKICQIQNGNIHFKTEIPKHTLCALTLSPFVFREM